MNSFLNAEQRLRLKCVYLHSDKHPQGDKELSLEEVGFVLGCSIKRAKQVEEVAICKLRRRGNMFPQILDLLRS